MKRIFIPLLALLTPNTALASTSLATLNVDGDVALFTTAEAKTHEIPSCVDQSRKQEWAVSLDTASGKAVYSLLIAAMSGNRAITIESSLDCAGVGSVERAHKVTVDASPKETLSKNIYLYKADGVTKVGRVFDRNGLDQFYYIPVDENGSSIEVTELMIYSPNDGAGLYFKSTDCSGEALVPNGFSASESFRNKHYLGGRYLLKAGPSSFRGYGSYMSHNGNCVVRSNTSSQMYSVSETGSDPLCGENLCVVKEG